MTVSPRWPHDAADHQTGGDSAENNRPPTLFRLPNLNPAPVTPQPVSQPIETAESIRGGIGGDSNNRQSAPLNPPAQAIDITPAAADAAATEGQIAGELTPETAQPFSQRPLPPMDVPAGRSWMEVVRQHGVVVLLLLTVVATAIYTGRDTTIEQADDSVADIEAAANDEGIAANIPIPTHEHEADTGVASSPHTPTPGSNDFGTVERNTDEIATAGKPNQPFASLEPPQISTSQQVNAGQMATGASQVADEVAVNGLGDPQVDAMTVANRVEPSTELESDVMFNPPSLETLEDSLSKAEADFLAEEAGIRANSFVPVSSKTPAGISNWLKYLPASPNETSN